MDRLRERFAIQKVCVVADRGMISQETIRELTRHNLTYILGARLRAVKEIREQVLSRAGRYSQIRGPRGSGVWGAWGVCPLRADPRRARRAA